jgi:disulfide bond formation protein DsbB
LVEKYQRKAKWGAGAGAAVYVRRGSSTQFASLYLLSISLAKTRMGFY